MLACLFSVPQVLISVCRKAANIGALCGHHPGHWSSYSGPQYKASGNYGTNLGDWNYFNNWMSLCLCWPSAKYKAGKSIYIPMIDWTYTLPHCVSLCQFVWIMSWYIYFVSGWLLIIFITNIFCRFVQVSAVVTPSFINEWWIVSWWQRLCGLNLSLCLLL